MATCLLNACCPPLPAQRLFHPRSRAEYGEIAMALPASLLRLYTHTIGQMATSTHGACDLDPSRGHTVSPFFNPFRSRSFLEVIVCKSQALVSYHGRRTISLSHQVSEYDSMSSLSDSITPTLSVECWTLELVEIK